MASFLRRARTHVENAVSQAAPLADQVKGFATDIAGKFEREMHSHTHWGHLCATLHQTVHNQYHSFAPPRTQCDAKWYVDGCSYFYAMSIAIEQAHSQIWIMDWWLSPELYLRRPPSRNEQYRLDNMLKAAAERGVKVNIMVYKEVEKVLSCKSYILFLSGFHDTELLLFTLTIAFILFPVQSFHTLCVNGRCPAGRLT
jgi:hypothetical protein